MNIIKKHSILECLNFKLTKTKNIKNKMNAKDEERLGHFLGIYKN